MATRQKTVRISVSRNRERDDLSEPDHFNDMSRNVDSDLDKRKKDWEKDVEKIQDDFFKSKISTDDPVPLKKEGAVFDMIDKPSVDDQPDGSQLYTVRFRVKGFDADDISVKVEGRRLTVNAKREEDSGKGSKSTKQFNRSVDLPSTVDPDMVVSHLSDDGILTLEAPMEKVEPETFSTSTRHEYEVPESRFEQHRTFHDVPESRFETHRTFSSGQPSSGHVRRTYQSSSNSAPVSSTRLPVQPILYQPGSRTYTRTTYGPDGEAHRVTRTSTSSSSPRTAVFQTSHEPLVTSRTTTRRVISSDRSDFPNDFSTSMSTPGLQSSFKTTTTKSLNPNIEETEYGKKVNLVVDIGPDYEASDITIRPRYKKVSVNAVHEDKQGGRSSRRVFSRDIDTGEEIEPSTLRGSLAPNGKLHIGASVLENKEHDIVLGYVIQDLPRGARQVKVERD